jgi:uncharacterized membrane protein
MLTWISQQGARLLAVCFILYGILFASFFAVNMPPFQNADEHAHTLRAAQISRGQLVGKRYGNGSSGGMVDSGLAPTFWPFGALLFHPDAKVTRGMYSAAARGWTGQYEWQAFTNTAVYPPTFYLPAAVGLWIGRNLDMSILQSLYLARLGNALVAVLLGGVGIWASGRAAPFLFAVLSLPMTMALMANVSQDGVMIGCTALAAGLIAGGLQSTGCGSVLPRLAATSVALALVCMARPPYAPLAVTPLLVPGAPRKARVVAAAAILLACAGWSAFMAVYVMGVLRPDNPAIDPSGQIRWIIGHPLEAASVLVFSIRVEASILLEQFIGRLGWLDTALPDSYRVIAAYSLPLAAALAFDTRHDGQSRADVARLVPALAASIAILACVALMFLIQYITWNAVGRAIIEGVQGRYFLPLAVMAAMILPALPAAPRPWEPVRGAMLAGLMLFPAVSIGVVIRAVVLRYYLT